MADPWLVGVLIVAALLVALLIGVAELRHHCQHHWHPDDPMIAWRCCWCGRGRDGMPANDTPFCRRAVPPNRARQ